MGIANPVTRRAAGSRYHEELSRQIADFLVSTQGSSASMIPVTDLFCLYNRARGTALISPDDLLEACRLFERLNLAFRLRKFDSGVLVVQSASYSDAAMSAQLLEMLSSSGDSGAFLTAMDVAEQHGVSLPLAMEHLQTAEKLEKLCRDETPNGVRFYPNLYLM